MARTDLDQLVLTMSADIRRLEKGLDKAQGKMDSTARAMEKRQKELDKNLAKLGEAAGEGFGRASVAAGLAFGAITGYAIKAAADANEIANAFNVAFGDMSDEARAFAKTFSESVGRSFYETQESMSRARLVLDGFGFSGQQALDIVEQIQARSVDIGSLFNVKDADAFAAIISGLTGETEPMKRFGVVVNQAAIEAELLRLGFKGNVTEASEQAKVLARLNLMLAGTSKAQGDAANTAESLSNQQKRLQGEVRDSAVELGQRFLPVAQKVIVWANDALTAFNNLPTGVQNASLALLAMVAAGGPIAAAIGGLAKLITYARNARIAMLALGGANAAAGAAGVAGGAAAGAGLVAGGAVAGAAAVGVGGAAVIASESAIQGARKRVADDLAKASERDLMLALKATAPARGQAGFNKMTEAIQAELAKRGGQASVADVEKQAAAAAKAAAGGTPGGFSLAPNQLAPVAGSGGGKGRAAKAKKAEEQEEDLTEITDRLIQAREDFTRVQEKALDDATRLRVAELDGQAEVLSLQGDMAKTMAERRSIELRLLDLAIERERVELAARAQSNDPGEAAEARQRLQNLDATTGMRRDQVNRGTQGPLEAYTEQTRLSVEQLNEATQEWAVQGLRDLTTSLADAAVAGEDLGDVAKNVFRQMAADMLAQMLSQTAGRAGASILSAIIPGFAGGTDSAPGGMAIVGERGPELVNLPRGSQVIPNHQLKRATGGGDFSARIAIDLTGANGDATIARIANDAARQGATQAFAAAMKATPSRMQKQAWSGT